MKKTKIALSLLLVFALFMQLCSVGFAANTGAICYQTDGLKVTATIAVSGLSKEAKLVTAVYDASGNVVNFDISESAANAGAAYLKTTVTKEAESDVVKSFIWNADDNEPLSKAGVLGYEATEDDVEIFFDGVPFATAAGEALSFEKTSYNVTLGDADKNGIIEMPKVTYEVNDSTIDVDITNDYENLTSTIVIESGVRIATPVSVTNGATGTYDNYTKPYTHTITVNYVIPTDILTHTSYINAYTYGGVSGINGETAANKYYDYVLDFDHNESTTATKVEFTVTGLVNADSIIVVEPTGDDDTASFRDAVVNSDGSALTWEDDANVVYAYDYVGTTDAEKLVEPWDETRATYGQRASTSPVSITYDSGTAASHKLMRRVQDTDNYFVTGNYARCNDRYPAYGQIEFISPKAELLNCNYISMYNKDLKSKELTFSFYVNQDVKVHVVNKSNATTVKKTATGSAAVTGTASAAGFERRYQNTFPAFTVAYAVSKGYANVNDVSAYNAARNKTVNFTWNDVSYTYTFDMLYLRKWASVYAFIADGYSSGTILTPEALEVLGYEPEEGSTDSAKTYKLSSFWGTNGSLAGIQEAVDAYKKISHKIGNEYPVITNPVMGTGVNANGDAYDFNQADGTSTIIPTAKVFPDIASGNRSLLTERNGINRNNLTGMIKSYPEALDLEDGVFLQAMMRAGEGTANVHKNTYSTEQVPFYTFTVNYDSRVIIAVYSNSADSILPLINEGYTRSTPADTIIMQYTAPSNTRQFATFYTKEFNAGSTVTVYTPGKLAYVACFVKPLNN